MASHTSPSSHPRRLGLAIGAVVLQWLLWGVLPVVAPQTGLYTTIGGVVLGVVVLAWWLFFSRAPWIERIGAVVLMIAAVGIVALFVHESIANGMMGMMLPLYAVPVMSLAIVAWAVLARGLDGTGRYAALVLAVALGASVFTVIRTGGITGEGNSDLRWRWTPTPEQRLLASAPVPVAAPVPAPALSSTPSSAPSSAPSSSPPSSAPEPAAPSGPRPAPSATAPAAAAPSEAAPPLAPSAAPSAPMFEPAAWPGFRGPLRDGVVRGVRIETDWAASPPAELWRHPIGPGWSSFAVAGDFIYTQEQRGDDEVVSCYRLSTGAPVWQHRDAVRFWESNGGAGPRATPSVHGGRVYSMGATGLVNALDARTGARLWSRNAATDTDRTIPDWGLASSPLVIDDVVVVAAAGRLAAYDAGSGDLRWLGPDGGGGYSSPHLVTIDGVRQILLLRGSRTTSVAPADGTVLWEHRADPAVAIVQPGFSTDGGLLVSPGDAMGGIGMRRLAVARGATGWTVEEQWTTRGLKPYFNDFVVHRDHAFGFDGSILASISLTDGTRAWKGGRYGHGQMVLLPDQDLLLVLSEDGDLALVSATPDKYTEIARTKAIEGKTWNHPVLVGDTLLVRNGEEMAAYRLASSSR